MLHKILNFLELYHSSHIVNVVVKSPESLASHLTYLLAEAERRVQELGGSGTNSGNNISSSEASTLRTSFAQHSNLAACTVSSDDRQLTAWVKRAQALRKMLHGFDQASKLYQ